MSGKQYGLQIPKKANQKPLSRAAVFNDDSDSEKSDGGGDWVKKTAKSFSSSSISKRQTKVEIDKALQEDATVFQYDEIYDDLELQKQSNSSSSREKERKPKYVQKLLVAAEKRKMENERRHERIVQKEREAEGDEFKDKETFVTSAYKRKLEEFAKLDAEQKRMDMLEDIGDVTKQQDMSGFYRHLYSQTVEKKEAQEDVEEPKEKPSGKDGHAKNASRQYRKRKDSDSSVDKDQDADWNFASSSSSSDSSDSESGEISSHSDTEDPKRLRLKKYKKESAPKVKNETPVENKPTIKTEDVKPEIKKKEADGSAAPEIKEKLPPPPPVDIWKKRTVGIKFDEALERYLKRKAARKTS